MTKVPPMTLMKDLGNLDLRNLNMSQIRSLKGRWDQAVGGWDLEEVEGDLEEEDHAGGS